MATRCQVCRSFSSTILRQPCYDRIRKAGVEKEARNKTWVQMRDDLNKVMQKVKDDLDSYNYGHKLENWEIPKVFFVEARVPGRDWAFIPKQIWR
jgi:hypothetical protein